MRTGTRANVAERDEVTRVTVTSRKRRAPLTERPESWKPTDAHAARARELGLDLAFQADQFCAFHDSKGNLFVNWDRAFWTWLGNARQFGGKGGGPRNGMAPHTELELRAMRLRAEGR